MTKVKREPPSPRKTETATSESAVPQAVMAAISMRRPTPVVKVRIRLTFRIRLAPPRRHAWPQQWPMQLQQPVHHQQQLLQMPSIDVSQSFAPAASWPQLQPVVTVMPPQPQWQSGYWPSETPVAAPTPTAAVPYYLTVPQLNSITVPTYGFTPSL